MRQDKPTSTFDGSREEADRLTREAWQNGQPVPGRPNVKEHDFARPIGIGPRGGGQMRVRVHQDAGGHIHGHPSGPEQKSLGTPSVKVAEKTMTHSTSSLPAEIRQAILGAYGPDLAEPQYRFVLPRMELPLYARLAGDFRRLGFSLSDQTDTNTDVSFQWLLSDGQWRGLLEVSVVGPFAVLSRLDAAGSRQVVRPDNLLPVETVIVDALAQHGFRLLTPDVLRLPVQMPFVNVDHGTVYAALFADDHAELN